MNDFKNDSLEHHLVSICSLTYNVEAYIKQTLKSFLMQSAFYSYEKIIHDDASTDIIKSRYHSNQRWSSIRQSSKVFLMLMIGLIFCGLLKHFLFHFLNS